MTPEEAKFALRTFGSKFDRMTSFSFFQHKEFSMRMVHSVDKSETVTHLNIPSEEQIDAVILNLRFFVVENESSGWKKLPEVYAALTIPNDLRAKFDATYRKWTEWRALPSRVGPHNNAEFFSIMIYGERVHRNQPKFFDVYDKWMKQKLLSDFASLGLCEAIMELTILIGGVYEVNKQVLAVA